jgi:serine phosphatase RsbU (regulator of sigma subunit)
VAAAELVDRLVVAVREFAGEEPQGDDQTVVVLKVVS